MFAVMMAGCGTSSIDGQIGDQIWMTENLNVDQFRNGDLIPHARTAEEWIEARRNRQPAWSYYNNDPAMGEKYGKLYNWYAVNDSRGLAPEGWKIPSNADWAKLAEYLGGFGEAGIKMKNTRGWDDNGNGTNKSGFSALPGGERCDHGFFSYLGIMGFWWSSSEDDNINAWYFTLSGDEDDIERDSEHKAFGFSVRCIKDN